MKSANARNGVTVFLVALLIVTSSLAALYYDRYQAQVAESNGYVGELRTALADYDHLSTSYSVSLEALNKTITLLTEALSNLNTSVPAYALGSEELGAIWNQYLALARANGNYNLSYQTSMLISFGNGTTISYLDKPIEPGWNAYVSTLALLNGSVQAIWYPEYQEHLVTAIDAVAGTQSTAWFIWTRNGTNWSVAPSGADLVQVNNGSTFAWTLCTYNANFEPNCEP